MLATDVTMGLAEWIINDTCLVSITTAVVNFRLS